MRRPWHPTHGKLGTYTLPGKMLMTIWQARHLHSDLGTLAHTNIPSHMYTDILSLSLCLVRFLDFHSAALLSIQRAISHASWMAVRALTKDWP